MLYLEVKQIKIGHRMRSRSFDDLLDEEEFLRFYDAAYGHLEGRIRDDAVVSVCWLVGDFLNYTTVPVFKPHRVWDEIVKHAGSYCTWMGVNPLNPDTVQKRGTKDDVLLISSLVCEWDTEDGYHKPRKKKGETEPERLITRAEARERIDTLSQAVEFTMVNNSGGGYHGWVTIDDDLAPNSPLVERWKHHTSTLGVDESVSGDISRIMRPAGVLNHKFRTALQRVGDSWGDGTRPSEGRDEEGEPTWIGARVESVPMKTTIIDHLSQGV